MSELSLEDLAARLDELSKDVRRQGRAALAAQAAAESCLEKLSETTSDTDDEGEEEPEAPPAPDLGWVQAMLPVADAIDRMLAQATAMVEPRAVADSPPAPKGLFSLFRRPTQVVTAPLDREPDLRALLEGLRVLRSQLGAAFEQLDVKVDRRTGVPVDPEVHRVVEVRPTRANEAPDRVLEVIRPGYMASGRVIREAEVVAAAPHRT